MVKEIEKRVREGHRKARDRQRKKGGGGAGVAGETDREKGQRMAHKVVRWTEKWGERGAEKKVRE